MEEAKELEEEGGREKKKESGEDKKKKRMRKKKRRRRRRNGARIPLYSAQGLPSLSGCSPFVYLVSLRNHSL